MQLSDIPTCIGDTFDTFNKMAGSSKWDPEIAGLCFVDLPTCGQLFFGTDWSNAINYGNTARSFSGLGATVYSLTEVGKTIRNGKEKKTKFYVSALKGVKYGRSFLADLSKKKIIAIPGACYIEKLSLVGKIAGIVASVLELYDAFYVFYDSGKILDNLNGAKLTPKQEKLKLGCQSLRRENFLILVKNICSIVVAVFGSISLVLIGASLVIGPTEAILNLIAGTSSFTKTFFGHYDYCGSKFENEKAKKEAIDLAKLAIQKQFYPQTA